MKWASRAIFNCWTALDWPMMWFSVGGAVAPPFFGWIADIGRPELIFWMSGAATVLCVVSVYGAMLARR